MTVPEYQTFMAPVLRALQDGQPRSASEIREVVAAEMGVTEEDRQELIKSGIPVFDNRVGWAITYMVQAGLIRRPRRAINQITERGLQVLRDHPARVDNRVLTQFEEFREFKSRARTQQQPDAKDDATQPASAAEAATSAGAPRETITTAIKEN